MQGVALRARGTRVLSKRWQVGCRDVQRSYVRGTDCTDLAVIQRHLKINAEVAHLLGRRRQKAIYGPQRRTGLVP